MILFFTLNFGLCIFNWIIVRHGRLIIRNPCVGSHPVFEPPKPNEISPSPGHCCILFILSNTWTYGLCFDTNTEKMVELMNHCVTSEDTLPLYTTNVSHTAHCIVFNSRAQCKLPCKLSGLASSRDIFKYLRLGHLQANWDRFSYCVLFCRNLFWREVTVLLVGHHIICMFQFKSMLWGGEDKISVL